MPGQNKKMNSNSKDEIVILDDKAETSEPQKMVTSSSQSNRSSLSVLNDNLIKQIVSVAEIAIKNHVKQQKVAATITKDDDDDEIQVLSETKTTPVPPKSNQTVLQLGLPKELQYKIIEQLKASGKSAAQIDLHNLFSEVFSKTMKKMNGLEVSNCSLRFTSNGKRRQSSDNSATATSINDGASSNSQDEAVPSKKYKKTTTLNNNKTSHINDEKLPNGGHRPSQETGNNGNGSENNGFIVGNSHDLDNNQPTNSRGKRRPVGRPSKKLKSPIIHTLKPKQQAQRSSKRLHDHSMKDWPYHAPPPPPPVEEVKKEEPQKKKIKMGPHRESTKVKSLRRIPPLSMHKNGQLYVSINLFTHLFHNFKMDTSCLMSFLVMLFGDPSKDFVFKKWQITHLSLRAAQEIVNVMRKPLYLVNIFDQLETLPTVPLKKVSHDTYKKTHLTQLSRNEFCNLFALGPAPVRVSKRTKMPTQKFQDSPCITSMATLSSSITSPPKKSSNSFPTCSKTSQHVQTVQQTKEEILNNFDKSWISGRLRPRYRKLLDKKKPKLALEDIVTNETNPEEIIEDNDFSHLAEVACDENEIIVLEEDEDFGALSESFMDTNSTVEETISNSNQNNKPEVIPKKETEVAVEVDDLVKTPVKTEIDEIDNYFNSENSSAIPTLKKPAACRKFPSYGWNREREARIRIEANEPTTIDNSAAVAVPTKKLLSRNLPDFPPFQLSGLVETAPKEVEGWFTSKVKLLRQLSEASGHLTKSSSNNSTSPNSSRSGSMQKKTTKKSSKGHRVPVKAFLDNEVESIVDLLEYRQNLEQINSIIEEIEEIESKSKEFKLPKETTEISDQVINETLRVAKKIEKISIAGIGRQVSLPSPQSFLPPGWHCRKTGNGKTGCAGKTGSGWEYVNSDGYKVKSIQAAIKHEAEIRSLALASTPSSTATELLNTTVP